MKDYHEKFVDARDYNASIQFWSEWRVDDGEVLINSRYENAVIFDEVFTSGDPVGEENCSLKTRKRRWLNG